MRFAEPLTEGRLIRRYKRFLADVELTDGSIVTAHSGNTGSMSGCCAPGSRVWLRDSHDPSRKCRYSWELIEVARGICVGINTALANRLVREAIEDGVVSELAGYPSICQEVRYGRENSRIDLLLESDQGAVYVEVKSVTLVEDGIGFFPDAVSVRGAKHLRELAAMAEEGHRAVIFYCVQRQDARQVRPADAIDPAYGKALRAAIHSGVEAFAYGADVGPQGISLVRSLPVRCP